MKFTNIGHGDFWGPVDTEVVIDKAEELRDQIAEAEELLAKAKMMLAVDVLAAQSLMTEAAGWLTEDA